MSYIQEAAEKGYVFECGCGELFREAGHAWNCRKCRTYLTDEDFFNRAVVNTTTGQPVPLEWSAPAGIEDMAEV